MNIASIVHSAKSRYSYMYDNTTLHVRIKTGINEVEKITVRAVDPFNWVKCEEKGIYVFDEKSIMEIPMTYEGQTEYHDVWFAEIKGIDTLRIRYSFVMKDREEQKEYLYGVNSVEDIVENPESLADSFNFFNFPYLNEEDTYKAPEWTKNAVWYQLTPTCFSDNGNECNGNHTGNFEGLTKKLDYIKELGCTAIYMTPIFEGYSWHLYDTTDYKKVSEKLGGDKAFKEFVEKAHSMGLKIMLDAVFNHCGLKHPFWQDVLKYGKESKYYDCFYVLDESKPILKTEVREDGFYEELGDYDNNIRTFGYVTHMPKMNTSHPLIRQHLLDVGTYWVKEFGIDAWRLDVSNEVSHDFWREFRKAVKGANPDVYIMGENWDDSYPWLMGDQFDSVMNYGIMNLIWGLIAPKNEKTRKITGEEYKKGICDLITKYPKHVTEHMFNLIASHDVVRLLSLLEGNKKKLQLCYVLLLTFSGSPCIYYGDEIGVDSETGESRVPMIWDKEKQDQNLLAFMKKMISLRKEYTSLSSMNYSWIEAKKDSNIVAYKKEEQDESVYVIVNNSEQEEVFVLPEEMKQETWTDLYHGTNMTTGETLVLQPYEFYLIKK